MEEVSHRDGKVPELDSLFQLTLEKLFFLFVFFSQFLFFPQEISPLFRNPIRFFIVITMDVFLITE